MNGAYGREGMKIRWASFQQGVRKYRRRWLSPRLQVVMVMRTDFRAGEDCADYWKCWSRA